jgi:hypothetical protein
MTPEVFKAQLELMIKSGKSWAEQIDSINWLTEQYTNDIAASEERAQEKATLAVAKAWEEMEQVKALAEERSQRAEQEASSLKVTLASADGLIKSAEALMKANAALTADKERAEQERDEARRTNIQLAADCQTVFRRCDHHSREIQDLTATIAAITPLVNTDEYGRPVLEWWDGYRKLTVYIEKANFIKVWGPSIDTEMEDGEITTPQDVWGLYRWLVGKEPQP